VAIGAHLVGSVGQLGGTRPRFRLKKAPPQWR